jgi:hypothetical protein
LICLAGKAPSRGGAVVVFAVLLASKVVMTTLARASRIGERAERANEAARDRAEVRTLCQESNVEVKNI